LFEQHKDDVQFFVVYIKEAHALDSTRPSSARDQPIVQEPITWKERAKLAQQCTAALELDHIPTLIDEVNDGVGTRYAAWPDRLYLVSKNGRIAYAGGAGPRGFKPDELGEAIQADLSERKKK
jgi:hypothetical protein